MAALYSSAAQIVEKIVNKRGSAKSLIINSPFGRKKKLYALVCETLKYKGVIDEILDQTKLLKLEKKLKYNYSLVLVYDFLFGQGLQSSAKLRQCILKHKSALQSSLARLKVRAKVHRNEDLLPQEIRETASLPRYVRINRIKTTLADVEQHFKSNGYDMNPSQDLSSFIAESKQNPRKVFMCDTHLPDLLVFPPGTDLHNHPLYTSGHIVLQDKASCLPAHVLSPPSGSRVIDACAAPGNKSNHVASLINNQGKIFAFDTDNKRLKVMRKLMKMAGVNCVTITNCSFLDVDPSDEMYSGVEYIVVDPSCSGSGIASRMDSVVDKGEKTHDKELRLNSLAKFQLAALNHALSFPNVKRVVYSTCSVHQRENEDVVAAALKENSSKFEIGHALPSWPHRGVAVFPDAEKCIRSTPQEDHTNGFFVALFLRKENATYEDSSSASPPRKKMKKAEGDLFQGLSVPSMNVAAGSVEGNPTSCKKRRKRRKKTKTLDSNRECERTSAPSGTSHANDGNRKKKKKKKGKKMPVCS